MEIDVLYGADGDTWLLQGEFVSRKNDTEAIVRITDKRFQKWQFACDTDEELEEEGIGEDDFMYTARLLDETLKVRNDEFCYCPKGFITESDCEENENWFTFVKEREKEPTKEELSRINKQLELYWAFNSRFGNV